MPPRKNVAPSNAVLKFYCELCMKGYPRQPEYENHLRSYDHNHRQRLADMRKLTAQNDEESRSKKPAPGIKNISLDAARKVGSPAKFTKIGGARPAGAGFTKVGVTVKSDAAGKAASEKKTAEEAKGKEDMETLMKEQAEIQKKIEALQAEKAKTETGSPNNASTSLDKEDESMAQKEDEDVIMAENGDVEMEATGDGYAFTKPTECDHKNCPGRITDGVWVDTLKLDFGSMKN